MLVALFRSYQALPDLQAHYRGGRASTGVSLGLPSMLCILFALVHVIISRCDVMVLTILPDNWYEYRLQEGHETDVESSYLALSNSSLRSACVNQTTRRRLQRNAALM